MRVAKLTSFFHPVKGGMENHLYYEGLELLKLGHKVIVLTSDFTRNERIKEKKANVDGIEVRRILTWFRFGNFTPIFHILRFAKEIFGLDYDILHIHSYRQFHNLGVFIAKLRGKKVVLSTHWPEYPKEIRGNFLHLMTKLIDYTIGPLILRSADKLVVQTEAEKQWLQNRFSIAPEKIAIIPPGLHNFYLDKRSKTKFRKEHNIKEKYVVLTIGRLHKSKGLDKLIWIANKFENTKFIFVGPDHGHREELEKLAKELKVENKILFVGEVSEEEKLDALASCDVLVMPSDYEAFGISLVEAMAQGKPVIAHNAGGMPSVIQNYGYVFNDLNELNNQLKLLLADKNLREKLGKEGKKYAETLIWSELTKKLENLYMTLLKRSNAEV
ncbi:MAG: glycosyltransferase family 4 protein [Nanoarchaeota archaeon]